MNCTLKSISNPAIQERLERGLDSQAFQPFGYNAGRSDSILQSLGDRFETRDFQQDFTWTSNLLQAIRDKFPGQSQVELQGHQLELSGLSYPGRKSIHVSFTDSTATVAVRGADSNRYAQMSLKPWSSEGNQKCYETVVVDEGPDGSLVSRASQLEVSSDISRFTGSARTTRDHFAPARDPYGF